METTQRRRRRDITVSSTARDLLPSEMQETHTVTVNGLKMGGQLSVCFLEGLCPILKIGGDEVILKMHSKNKSYWDIESLKVTAPNSEGKCNMKVLFVDEIVNLAGNLHPYKGNGRIPESAEKRYGFKTLISWNESTDSRERIRTWDIGPART